MSDYRTFTREDRNGVAVVSFRHPPINLIDRAMVIDLLHLADELERDADIRVVLFRSSNPDFFLAHYDLGSQLDAPPMKLPAGMASPLSALFSRFSRLPQVTIGELRGRARGAGSEFLLALDMRFASRERALLGQPEVAVGLLPGAGGTVRLAQMLGRGRALEVCLGGEDFDADTAERYGWINRALADSELEGFCEALARRIAAFPAAGIAHVKAVVDQVTVADQAALAEESQRFVGDMSAPGTVERVRWMMDNGGQRDGELERDLGAALGRYPG
ncbi:enoyl-CoA hydratase/isomerase family protein [Pseudomonas multiresinivorans]|uniref:Enoyl-CoA hydratase/isomerase family protein n=1 Tax=Pseudomonas multiresinivorans TaxID=95301 RepID=A0A7Z3GRL1_9PSED|nr:enoyl-CoA hydratase/isomerase family protein [Pseudomonas multiresinivorans]QJP10248.1 enoyl-CoA hydratase/isomerase family protein [Pseudomonas multiresinivorans]